MAKQADGKCACEGLPYLGDVRMLAVNCDQSDSYEITMNGYQTRKINEIRNVIFGLQLWDTFLSVKAEVGMFTKLIT